MYVKSGSKQAKRRKLSKKLSTSQAHGSQNRSDSSLLRWYQDFSGLEENPNKDIHYKTVGLGSNLYFGVLCLIKQVVPAFSPWLDKEIAHPYHPGSIDFLFCRRWLSPSVQELQGPGTVLPPLRSWGHILSCFHSSSLPSFNFLSTDIKRVKKHQSVQSGKTNSLCFIVQWMVVIYQATPTTMYQRDSSSLINSDLSRQNPCT